MMSVQKSCTAGAILALLCIEMCGRASAEEGMLRVIHDGYVHNRELFRHFSCRFNVTHGNVNSIDDVRAQRLKNKVSRSGIWIVDGRRARYELHCDKPVSLPRPEPSEQYPGLAFGVVECDSDVHLTDGEVSMFFLPTVKNATVRESTPFDPGITITPFSMGVMGPDEDHGLSASIEGRMKLKCSFQIQRIDDPVAGKNVYQVTESSDDVRLAFRRDWYLDPERGFLPVRIETVRPGRKPRQEAIVTEVRACQNGGYFPIVSRVVSFDESTGTPYKLQFITVSELELKKPAADDFTVTLPQGTTVVNPSNLQSAFTLESPKTVSDRDIHKLIQQCEEQLAHYQTVLDEYGLLDKRVSSSEKSTTNRARLVSVLLAAFVIGSLLFFGLYKYRRGKPSGREVQSK